MSRGDLLAMGVWVFATLLGSALAFPGASKANEVDAVAGVAPLYGRLVASKSGGESGLGLDTSRTHVICGLPVSIALLLHHIPLPACRRITPGTLIRLFP